MNVLNVAWQEEHVFFSFVIMSQGECKNLHSHINTPQFSPGKHVHRKVSFQQNPVFMPIFAMRKK